MICEEFALSLDAQLFALNGRGSQNDLAVIKREFVNFFKNISGFFQFGHRFASIDPQFIRFGVVV